MKVGVVQQRANGSGEDALAHADGLVREVAAAGAEVVVLPELFRWPYPAQVMEPGQFDMAESVAGEVAPTASWASRLAKELGIVLVSSLFEEAAPGLGFNTALVHGPQGELLATYRKAHIPDDPLYYEKFYFTPGDTPFGAVQTPFGMLGVLICWDQWYPEAARLVAMAGAQVIVYPTAIGTIESEGPEEHARQLDAWRTIQRSHAIANGVYVAAVNRAGQEGELGFWGHSFVAGPQGEVLWKAGTEGDTTHVVDCPLGRVAEVRRMWPFFRDRRIDLYGGLLERWGNA